MSEETDVAASMNAFKERCDAGEPVPPVEVSDLKYFWKRSNQVRQRPGVAIGMGAFGNDNPFYKLGERAPAVWFRCGFLQFLLGQGVLNEWQHGEELDEAVFRVAATISLEELASGDREQLDIEQFVLRVREASGANDSSGL